MTKPHYPEALLLRLCEETKDIADHEKLILLYQNLEAQGDIEFSEKIKSYIARPKHYFRFITPLITMAKLCEYNLKLTELQEKRFAIVTTAIIRRLDHQRELINQKYLKR